MMPFEVRIHEAILLSSNFERRVVNLGWIEIKGDV